jgi:toxin ParE1/3/4
MTRAVAFHPEALSEFLSSVSYYQAKAHGLGESFADYIQGAIDQIRKNPVIGSNYEAGTRKIVLRRFPFSIVYDESNSAEIIIVAIIHHRRKPGYWKERSSASG